MQLEPSQAPRAQDRRVVRSRAALMAAAVRLVTERGTTAISVTDLAEAANVSRQLVYLQFGDRDSLLVEAAMDLHRRDFLLRVQDEEKTSYDKMLAMSRYFARHRSFYRAMLTGSCAFAMARSLTCLFSSLTRQYGRVPFAELDEETAEDLAVFIAGGIGTVVQQWLVDGEDPLKPEVLADRLRRLFPALLAIPPAIAGADAD